MVGSAASSAAALEHVGRLATDVALLDIDLGGESDLELARRLQNATATPPRIILISTRDESEYADLVADSPAVGFLAKTNLSAEGSTSRTRSRSSGSAPTTRSL